MSPAQFAALYISYYSLVLAVARRFVGQHKAEDVCHEVFLEAMSRGNPVLLAGMVDWQRRAWLVQRAEWRSQDVVLRDRATSRQGSQDEFDTLLGREGAPDDAASADERRQLVLDAVASLTRRQRLAVELRWFGGLTEREVAEHLGATKAAVRSAVYRACNRLRSRLRDLAPPLATPSAPSVGPVALVVGKEMIS